MASGSNTDDFSFSGPSELTKKVNWGYEHHQRSVAACLVNGVYIQERDRQKNRQNAGQDALAPPWWESFHFKLYGDPFIDEKDNSIFGAIYKFNGPPAASTENAPPEYVIAFRGTIIKMDSFWEDIKNNLKITVNKLHLSSRFKDAMEHVLGKVSSLKAAKVWLAGHSQGSATAMLVGNRMIKTTGINHFETFLFNPPFIISSLDWIKSERVKNKVRLTGSYLKAGLAVAAKPLRKQRQQDESFSQSSNWIPNLFVNPKDPICNGYIDYFEHRGEMEEIGAGKIEKLATKTSIRSLISYLLGRDSEPFHLIPSARLIINTVESSSLCTKSAHKLLQW